METLLSRYARERFLQPLAGLLPGRSSLNSAWKTDGLFRARWQAPKASWADQPWLGVAASIGMRFVASFGVMENFGSKGTVSAVCRQGGLPLLCR
jgi:hypothetical protein